MIGIYVRIMIVCIGWYRLLASAMTITDIVHQASLLPEYVIPDNHNLLVPDYLSLYKQSPFAWLLSASVLLYTSQQPRDIVERVERLLTTVVRDRESEGFAYPHIIKKRAKAGDVLLVWSDLQSGFHSFVRALVDLHRSHIIDDQLRIIPDNYYIIFNGNVVGVAPYKLELLALVLQLMAHNRDRVFYTIGAAEDRELWIEQGVLRQAGAIVGLEGAKFATGAPYARFTRIEHMLARFFATVPRAVYIDYSVEGRSNLIAIAALGVDTVSESIRFCGDFFQRPYRDDVAYNTYRIEHRVPTTGDVRVRAYILSIDRLAQFIPTRGLTKRMSASGEPLWSVFSGQIALYRDIENFIYDAYASIVIADAIADTTITVVNHNIYTRAPFVSAPPYLLITGEIAV